MQQSAVTLSTPPSAFSGAQNTLMRGAFGTKKATSDYQDDKYHYLIAEVNDYGIKSFNNTQHRWVDRAVQNARLNTLIGRPVSAFAHSGEQGHTVVGSVSQVWVGNADGITTRSGKVIQPDYGAYVELQIDKNMLNTHGIVLNDILALDGVSTEFNLVKSHKNFEGKTYDGIVADLVIEDIEYTEITILNNPRSTNSTIYNANDKQPNNNFSNSTFFDLTMTTPQDLKQLEANLRAKIAIENLSEALKIKNSIDPNNLEPSGLLALTNIFNQMCKNAEDEKTEYSKTIENLQNSITNMQEEMKNLRNEQSARDEAIDRILHPENHQNSNDSDADDKGKNADDSDEGGKKVVNSLDKKPDYTPYYVANKVNNHF